MNRDDLAHRIHCFAEEMEELADLVDEAPAPRPHSERFWIELIGKRGEAVYRAGIMGARETRLEFELDTTIEVSAVRFSRVEGEPVNE